jgi:ABC-2 type transport system ATP-binding protein
MNEQPVLSVSNLVKHYGEVEAVDRVSFEVGAGEIVGLLGPNGAGKTTTINMILGVLEPTGGSLRILGEDLNGNRSNISGRVNFAAVYAHVPPNLTVRQNLRVFGMLYGVPRLKARISELIAEFDLEQFADVRAGLLSSGEASRLNLAKALINEPSLLLLDEPTASLDPSVAQVIREKIAAYVERTRAGVLWTSHNMREIELVCNRVLFLSHGQILLTGNPKTLPAEHGKRDLEELFIAVAREPLTMRPQ